MQQVAEVAGRDAQQDDERSRSCGEEEAVGPRSACAAPQRESPSRTGKSAGLTWTKLVHYRHYFSRRGCAREFIWFHGLPDEPYTSELEVTGGHATQETL